MQRAEVGFLWTWILALAACVLGGCSRTTTPEELDERPQAGIESAGELFGRITRDFHLPSGEADGLMREDLLAKAARGYEELLERYPKESFWAAQALRSMGNVRSMQGQFQEALALYDRVAENYPGENWEIIQSWKTAGDLLEDRGNDQRAREYFQKIVDRFDDAEQPAVIQTIVRGCKARLARSNPSGDGSSQ